MLKVSGVWGGGIGGSPEAVTNVLDYVTISSTGNAQDFGDEQAPGKFLS